MDWAREKRGKEGENEVRRLLLVIGYGWRGG